MALKQDQERVKMLIQDTITLLCKNGLNYKNEFEIKALIGITIDKSDVFLLDINQNIEPGLNKGKQSTQQKEQEDAASSNTHEPSYSVRKAHKKRKRGAADNSGSKNTSGLIQDRDKDMNPAERGLSKDDLPARRNSEDDQPAVKAAKTTYDGHSVIAVKTEPTKTEPESDDNDDAADYSGWDETTEPEPGELSASEIRESQLEELSLSEIQSGELEEEDSPKTKQKVKYHQFLRTERMICDQCPASFKSANGLNDHRKSKHEHEFRFHCSVCYKGFQTKHHLHGHINSHYKIKPYKCNHCVKSFAYETGLRRHKCKEPKEPEEIKCYPCDKIFSTKQNLHEHNQTVHPKEGLQLLACVCGKKFKWRGSLFNHKKACEVVEKVKTEGEEGVVVETIQTSTHKPEFDVSLS